MIFVVYIDSNQLDYVMFMVYMIIMLFVLELLQDK